MVYYSIQIVLFSSVCITSFGQLASRFTKLVKLHQLEDSLLSTSNHCDKYAPLNSCHMKIITPFMCGKITVKYN